MRLACAVTCAFSLVASGCGSVGHRVAPADAPASKPGASLVQEARTGGPDALDASGEPYPWQSTTHSPQPAPPEDELGRACSTHDAALDRVAAFVARRETRGTPADAETVTDAMRAEGAPYVWPHIWLLSGQRLGEGVPARFGEWLATLPRVKELRCGSALASGARSEVAAAVAVDVLADLEPLPTNARPGAWLEVRARMLVATSAAQVLVLGPRGAPHSVPSSFDGEHVHARFNVDHEGAWLVQVLATVEGGPRPVAEAAVFAGAAPETLAPARAAPGEERARGAAPADAIAAMVNGARDSEGLAELVRDPRLDHVAEAHAETMRDAHHLAHEGTDGSPADRLVRAGIAASAVGENVAHAADAAAAHRTLWRSPSHRSNLLENHFDALGVGVARDADDTLWVCEVFAGLHTH